MGVINALVKMETAAKEALKRIDANAKAQYAEYRWYPNMSQPSQDSRDWALARIAREADEAKRLPLSQLALAARLRTYVPLIDAGAMTLTDALNMEAPKELSGAITALGTIAKTKDDRRATAIENEVDAVIAEHRRVLNLVGTYDATEETLESFASSLNLAVCQIRNRR